jgi:hypothetical protein
MAELPAKITESNAAKSRLYRKTALSRLGELLLFRRAIPNDEH